METSRQIIADIEAAAAAIQRQFLTLPGPGETLTKAQRQAVEKASEGLEGWRNWELGELKKEFKEPKT